MKNWSPWRSRSTQRLSRGFPSPARSSRLSRTWWCSFASIVLISTHAGSTINMKDQLKRRTSRRWLFSRVQVSFALPLARTNPIMVPYSQSSCATLRTFRDSRRGARTSRSLCERAKTTPESSRTPLGTWYSSSQMSSHTIEVAWSILLMLECLIRRVDLSETFKRAMWAIITCTDSPSLLIRNHQLRAKTITWSPFHP